DRPAGGDEVRRPVPERPIDSDEVRVHVVDPAPAIAARRDGKENVAPANERLTVLLAVGGGVPEDALASMKLDAGIPQDHSSVLSGRPGAGERRAWEGGHFLRTLMVRVESLVIGCPTICFARSATVNANWSAANGLVSIIKPSRSPVSSSSYWYPAFGSSAWGSSGCGSSSGFGSSAFGSSWSTRLAASSALRSRSSYRPFSASASRSFPQATFWFRSRLTVQIRSSP